MAIINSEDNVGYHLANGNGKNQSARPGAKPSPATPPAGDKS